LEYDLTDPRQVRGLAILAAGTSIEQAAKAEWRMPSTQDGGGIYRIRRGKTQWGCTCKDHRRRGLVCKHIHAVRFHLAKLQGQPLVPAEAKPRPEHSTRVSASEPASPDAPPRCPHCTGAFATRYGRRNHRQVWWCKPCQRKFIPDDGFKRIKGDANAATLALDLYFKGLSLRQITDTLAQFHDVCVDPSTVYRWLKRYVAILTECAGALKPVVGDKWNYDEMKVKYGGSWKWLWHVMDRDKRHILVSHVTNGRDLQDARTVFAGARDLAAKQPSGMVTDGLASYIEAWN
jgi:putative transposase